ncbi:plasmid replication initiator TrfA [Pseudomonas sp. PDM20]|uniref:plasmid replication initiator TrfA n=1 Tax=Pseudomonas sp. PDM20 TaxID=2769254 RepID=UPI001786B570|nr:plasmid replication initiator TrfA [Pseudomonas sp. PDM20]MBD9686806.1 TrfA protein [Pseudomonas sp. PDM20]
MDQEEFNEEEYKRRLIEMGVSEEDAAVIAGNRARTENKGQRTRAKKPAEGNVEKRAVQKDEAPAQVDAKAPTKPAKKPRQRPADDGPRAVRPSKAVRRSPPVQSGTVERLEGAGDQAAVTNTVQQMSLFEVAPWDDHMRGMPNDIARTALFTVRNKSVKREVLQQHPIYSYNDDVTITYSGIELRAEDDELVWQQVLEYAKRFPLGHPITFTFYELCKDLGWSINGRYYKKAEESLTRLQASALQYHSSRVGNMVSLSLLRRFGILDKGKRTSRCQVELEDEMVLLFAGGNYSKIVWEKYRDLKPTARRLFDYVVSHRSPYPLSLERFNKMCASDSDRPNRWRDQVKQACAELKESGLVEDSYVNGDLIYNKRGRPGRVEEAPAIEGTME